MRRAAPAGVPARGHDDTPNPLFGVSQSAIAVAALLDPR